MAARPLHTLGEPVLYALPWAGAGALLMRFALTLLVVAMRDVGASWWLGTGADHLGRLVAIGAYWLSRSPIFLFFDLHFLGTLLMNNNLVSLLLLACMVSGLHAQIQIEERLLARAHGARYAAVCRRTPR